MDKLFSNVFSSVGVICMLFWIFSREHADVVFVAACFAIILGHLYESGSDQ
jgi:hypothetical protein